MHYALFLELKNQPVVVVGAGKVAARKIRTLLAAEGKVTVISPEALGSIQNLAAARKVTWHSRPYRRGDLRGARLVVAATDDLDVNQAVCAEARQRKLLVNCIAPPADGDFIVPSLVRRGGITIAISTGGASPAFAKRLRLDLERFLGSRYPALLKRMAKTRLQQ